MSLSLTIALTVLTAYLLGSIPTAVWVGRLFYGIDIRTRGSGNAGATNTIRVLGLKAGLPVLVFDILKGWLALQVYRLFPGSYSAQEVILFLRIVPGAAVVLGHVFPLFAGFRGGKGVATLLGVGIALYPWAALIALCIFILVFVPFRYVSLASISAAVTFPFIEIFLLNHRESIALMILAILIGLFIPVTHRKNIRRLLQGTESKFRFKRSP
jgi:glycerol-3-phosphate acyltransferase PlsY